MGWQGQGAISFKIRRKSLIHAVQPKGLVHSVSQAEVSSSIPAASCPSRLPAVLELEMLTHPCLYIQVNRRRQDRSS